MLLCKMITIINHLHNYKSVVTIQAQRGHYNIKTHITITQPHSILLKLFAVVLSLLQLCCGACIWVVTWVCICVAELCCQLCSCVVVFVARDKNFSATERTVKPIKSFHSIYNNLQYMEYFTYF